MIALGFVLFPFFASLEKQVQESASESAAQRIIPLKGLQPGQLLQNTFTGEEVWIYRRRRVEIQQLEKISAPGEAPASSPGEPAHLNLAWRSLRAEYFVFSPLEPMRQCQVSYVSATEPTGLSGWRGGFYDPCYRAYFDLAGRRYANTGHPDQADLVIPAHSYQDAETLVLSVSARETGH